MKKNLTLKISAVALMLTMVTTTLLGGTLAKYIVSNTGTTSARVAKFVVGTNVHEIELFNTAYSMDRSDFAGLGHDDTVWSNNGMDKVIAPGTKGEFRLELDASQSEVLCEYSVFLDSYAVNGFEVNAAGGYGKDAYIPILFCVNGGNWVMLDELEGEFRNFENLLLDPAGETILIEWMWAFEDFDGETDRKDTELGLDGTASIILDIGATIQQID